MKYVLLAAMSMFSLFASAAPTSVPPANATNAVPAVQYDYSQKLDIAKVISLTTAASNECEPVQAHMIYLDSQGQRHNLQYLRLSESCAAS